MRAALRAMGRSLAEVPDALSVDGRRKAYRAFDLRVWANLDRSFKLTWMAGSELGELRWAKDRT